MNKTGERQRWMWLLCGTSAVSAACLCGCSWLWVLAGGAAAALYYIYLEYLMPRVGLARQLLSAGAVGKILAALLLGWCIFAMAWAANLTDAAFPRDSGFPGLAWVILALAAWGSGKGASACAGCCGVLSLFLAGLYGAIVLFAVPDVEVARLMPLGAWPQGIWALGVCLLPVPLWFLPAGRRKGTIRQEILLLPVFAAVLAAVTAGVLSPELAAARPAPFYDLARSVSILGVVEHIEPLVSAAMTMGVFALVSALACGCRGLAEVLGAGRWSGAVCCLGAAAVLFVMGTVSWAMITAGNLLFFLLFPVAAALFAKKRKKEKIVVDNGLRE